MNLASNRDYSHGAITRIYMGINKVTSFHPTTSNKSQQHAATHKMVCKRSQHVEPNNVSSCWPTMLRAFAQGFRTAFYERNKQYTEL